MRWLFAIILGGFALHLVLAVTHVGQLGVDGGAYKLTVNAVLGNEPTGIGFPRPPLAPGWLLVPFVELFGFDLGYKIWSAVASMLPVVPVSLLARRIGCPPALFAAGFLLLDPFGAEMIVTGSLPLIAFALLTMVWWSMSALSERLQWRYSLTLIACLGLIPFVNQTTAGIAVITIPIYGMGLWWFGLRATTWTESRSYTAVFLGRLLPPLFVGGLIALAALPWYLDVMPGSPILRYDGPWIYPAGIYDVMWPQAVSAISLGIFAAWKGEHPWLRSLGVVLACLGCLMPWLSYDETIINIFYRSSYLAPVIFYVLVSWAIWTKVLPWLKPGRRVLTTVISVAVAVMVVGYAWSFNNQARYSLMVSHDTQAALDVVMEENPKARILSNSFTLSLWIAALNRTYSPWLFTAPPPRAYLQDDEYARCVIGWVPGCDVAVAQERLGVEYALMDERWPYLNERTPGNYLAPSDQWEVTASTPWLELAFSRGDVRLWRLVAPR